MTDEQIVAKILEQNPFHCIVISDAQPCVSCERQATELLTHLRAAGLM